MQTDSHPNSQKPHVRRVRLLAMTSAAAIVVVGLSAFALLPVTHRQIRVANSEPVRLAANDSQARTPRMLENSQPFSFADLVERVSPAVVTITSETMTTEADADGDGTPDNLPAPFRDLFNQFNQAHPQQPHKAISAGSGFIIDKSGLIVTNNHVVDNGKKITVKLPDGRSFIATLVGTDPATDIAVLRIKSDKPLPTVAFGDDRSLRVGDWVVAVGNPFGLSNSVTAGIVSSLGRDVGGNPYNYNDFIQIDAPINRGNSGGPTFDLRGQVIGMNSMIFSPSGGSVGIGFAIPATTIHDVVGELEAHGKVARGWLGVEIQSVSPEIASSLGLKSQKGAIIATVVPDGPAAKAGIQQGDIVTAIDGKTVEDNRDVTRKVASVAAGATATFTVNRQGVEKQIKVQIGARPDDKVASAAPPTPALVPSTASAMGLGLSPLTPEARKTLNISDDVSGVVITKVDADSDAADKGLQPGDVVLKIGDRTVKTPQDVQSGVAEARESGRKSVLLLVAKSGGGTSFVPVDIGQTFQTARRPPPGAGLFETSTELVRMRILVVEDDLEAQRYLVQGLKESGHVVDDAADGDLGLSLALSRPYDVAIIDRMLPKMDGLGVVAEMREHGNVTPVLFLSALSEVDDRVKGLKAGGDDYLTKPYAFVELLARIDALMRRRSPVTVKTRLQVGDLDLDLLTRAAKRGEQGIDLQPREFRLLEYLMRHAGQVVTRTMLLESVWEYHFDPQTNVIDVHISRLRAKIDKGFDAPLLHTIRGAGYMIRAR